MHNRGKLLYLCFFLLLNGCGIQLATEVQSGRKALAAGNLDLALGHFQKSVNAQPDYVVDLAPLRPSLGYYLGRTYYESAKFESARDALAGALERNDADFMARLYQGLTLFRMESRLPLADQSLKFEEVLFALRERVSPRRVGAMVKERGVNFILSVESERELRRLGADDELVRQIRGISAERAKINMSTPPEGLSDIERSLKEIQIWQTRIQDSNSGRSWDTRKRISGQLTSSLSMVAANKTSGREFISGVEAVGRLIDEELDDFRAGKAAVR